VVTCVEAMGLDRLVKRFEFSCDVAYGYGLLPGIFA